MARVRIDVHIFQDYKRYLKCKQPHPGFELGLLCPFPTTITITPEAPPISPDNYKPLLVGQHWRAYVKESPRDYKFVFASPAVPASHVRFNNIVCEMRDR